MKKIVSILKLKIKQILIFTLIGGLVSFVATEFLISEMYTSSVTMRVLTVNPYRTSEGDIHYGEDPLFPIYFIKIKSKSVLEKVEEEIKKDGLYYKLTFLENSIKTKKLKEEAMFEISVTTGNKEYSRIVAGAVAEASKEEIKKTGNDKEVEIVTPPTLPENPSYPNKILFTSIGALITLIKSCRVIITKNLNQTKRL